MMVMTMEERLKEPCVHQPGLESYEKDWEQLREASSCVKIPP